MEFKTSHCFLTEFGGLAPAEESGAGREERGGLSSAVDVAAEAACMADALPRRERECQLKF